MPLRQSIANEEAITRHADAIAASFSSTYETRLAEARKNYHGGHTITIVPWSASPAITRYPKES